jgi:glutamate-1-semialdehyde 2,1-aminomutase
MTPDSRSKNDTSSALAAAEQLYVQRHPKSLALHQKAVESLPGGNTRSLLRTAPFPIFMKSGKGYELTDEDGHT